jgi:hypothetical protein
MTTGSSSASEPSVNRRTPASRLLKPANGLLFSDKRFESRLPLLDCALYNPPRAHLKRVVEVVWTAQPQE